MAARIIDGRAIAVALRLKIAQEVERLRETHRLTPGLAVVLVGDDPASQVYVATKAKQTRRGGHAVLRTSAGRRYAAAQPAGG